VNFQCFSPGSRQEMMEHRHALLAALIKHCIDEEPRVVDAGCGDRLLAKHFLHYVGVDLKDGHDIQDFIPKGDVVVLSDVLEHVMNFGKVLDNVDADYCLISVPVERDRVPDWDHVRRVTVQDIQTFQPKWQLLGKWFWILRPRLWRLRYFFPAVSVFAEEEITLWEVRE
jgi:hypothetical protein